MTKVPSIIVHGGSGTWPDDTHEAAITGTRAAASLGWKLLNEGWAAMDVIEQVVRVLEDDPTYDAGRGSYVNAAGQVELDAIVMDGETLKTGAVAALRGVANPISVARLVMARTPHNLLVGSGARQFAIDQGISMIAEETLLVGKELEKWQAIQVGKTVEPMAAAGKGTVGAVVRDVNGHIAVGTSTGGTLDKLPGRVGDSPLIGCGAYVDDPMGGASSTGLGEGIMKIVMAKACCDLMAGGMPADEAARRAVARLDDERIKGWGGVIAIDPQGRVGFAFNSAHLSRAYSTPDGEIKAEI
jgi:L-asparaginase / beta-aspartyl-peptidase